MSKEEFVSILDRQQQSGLSIKDFCSNEVYSVSCFHYWKSKYIGSRSSGSISPSSTGFVPVSLRPASGSSPKALSGESSGEGTITIDFPNGVKIHFRGNPVSGAALQVITQLCQNHVLPE